MFTVISAFVFYGGFFIYFVGIAVHLFLLISHGEPTPFFKAVATSIFWPAIYAYAFGEKVFRIIVG